MKYSVIMYNFRGYEAVHPLPFTPSNDIEYIYVTDNTKIRDTTWNVIVDPALANLSPFEQCYAVRFNLFNYATGDVCLYIDGSMKICKDVLPLFNIFCKSDAKLGVMVHPERSTMWDEYITWVRSRNYPKGQAFKCLAYMQLNGYDINSYHGLYEGGIRFIRNDPDAKSLDHDCFLLLKHLGNGGTIERIDQTVYSYLLNTKYARLPLFAFSHKWCHTTFIRHCFHKTSTERPHGRFPSSGFIRNHVVPINAGNF